MANIFQLELPISGGVRSLWCAAVVFGRFVYKVTKRLIK